MKTTKLIGCMVVMTLFGTTVIPMGAAAETTLSQKFEDTRDQGIHYFKKRRFRQAYLLLKRAYGMKGGNKDFLATFYLAKSCGKLLLLERAFDLAEQARNSLKPIAEAKTEQPLS